MYNTCLNNLIKSYSTIEKYPILALYLRDPCEFFKEFLLIEEVNTISICKRDSSKIITIDKSNLDLNISDLSLTNFNKKDKFRLFSLGKIEVYKKNINI